MTRVRGAAGAVAFLLLLAGCGGGSEGEVTASPSEPATARSLAAAVADAVRGPAGAGPSAAAPLAPRDGIGRDDLGVELAFPREVGDALHVRVVVTHGEADAGELAELVGLDCDGPQAEPYAGCEEEMRDGTRTVLVWEAEAPEEDPGLLAVVGERGTGADRTVVQVLAHGPPIPADLGDQRGLADALVDLVADPAVGFTTTPALLAEGEAVGDDVWLDYYGQGNGAPPPRGS